jgi:hypothetical protein
MFLLKNKKSGYCYFAIVFVEITNMPMYLQQSLVCHCFFVAYKISLLTKSDKYSGRVAILDKYNGILVKTKIKIPNSAFEIYVHLQIWRLFQH